MPEEFRSLFAIPNGADLVADDALPDYEPMLASYHAAFAAELEAMIGTLPIRRGNLVLELACGDGAYTSWLSDRVGPEGGVIGLDVSTGYLNLAREQAARREHSSRSRFVAGSLDRLPFCDDTFDVAWCAQSLFSLPEPVDSVTKLARVVKPGGLVAVLENDTLHQVLLPWPVDLELAVRKAEWKSLKDESAHPHKFYVGRRLVGVFREAGLVDLRVRSFASTRLAPLDAPTRTFLVEYLEGLADRVAPRLDPRDREVFGKLVEPGSSNHLLDRPDFQVTVLDHLIQGRTPSSGGPTTQA